MNRHSSASSSNTSPQSSNAGPTVYLPAPSVGSSHGKSSRNSSPHSAKPRNSPGQSIPAHVITRCIAARHLFDPTRLNITFLLTLCRKEYISPYPPLHTTVAPSAARPIAAITSTQSTHSNVSRSSSAASASSRAGKQDDVREYTTLALPRSRPHYQLSLDMFDARSITQVRSIILYIYDRQSGH